MLQHLLPHNVFEMLSLEHGLRWKFGTTGN